MQYSANKVLEIFGKEILCGPSATNIVPLRKRLKLIPCKLSPSKLMLPFLEKSCVEITYKIKKLKI